MKTDSNRDTSKMTDEEKSAWVVFDRMKENDPNRIECSMHVFCLMTFEEWILHFQIPLERIKKDQRTIYEKKKKKKKKKKKIIVVKKKCGEREGAPYVPHKEEEEIFNALMSSKQK